MKSQEFIKEGYGDFVKQQKAAHHSMGEYDLILQNMLKRVNMINRTGRLLGKPEGINPFLANIGAKGRHTSDTVSHPLTKSMLQAADKFITATSTGSNTTFTRQQIKQVADAIYKWSKAVTSVNEGYGLGMFSKKKPANSRFEVHYSYQNGPPKAKPDMELGYLTVNAKDSKDAKAKIESLLTKKGYDMISVTGIKPIGVNEGDVVQGSFGQGENI